MVCYCGMSLLVCMCLLQSKKQEGLSIWQLLNVGEVLSSSPGQGYILS